MVGNLFKKKTVRDIDLKGKHVLMRADYNVPIVKGGITDDYRIKQSLPTIRYILNEQPAALIILSHLGRPKSSEDKNSSLAPVVKNLSTLLGKEVRFAEDCVGDKAMAAAEGLPRGGILLLENVRFHPEEEKNDEDFAKAIIEAASAEVFVQDGFGVVHRAHATTDAIARQLPSVAGLLVEKEVEAITKVMHSPERPLTAVIGGAKISDKLDILNRMIELANCVAVGGAMANNFLLAEKVSIGKSRVERELLDETRQILNKAKKASMERDFNFLVPVDAVVSTDIAGRKPTRLVDISTHALADITSYPKRPVASVHTVAANELILDIGPVSAAQIAGAVRMSKTVIWNGTLGVAEIRGIAGAANPFSHATHTVAEAMISSSNKHKNKPFTLVGGGDTVAYIESQDMIEDFSHVSTGGGASLELLAGHKLPGLEALTDA
ncbi:MAG: phosphoglycerate kinase [Candidatus Saccharimonadales bacterium]